MQGASHLLTQSCKTGMVAVDTDRLGLNPARIMQAQEADVNKVQADNQQTAAALLEQRDRLQQMATRTEADRKDVSQRLHTASQREVRFLCTMADSQVSNCQAFPNGASTP